MKASEKREAVRASERLRELDEVIRNGVPDDAEPALWNLKPALPLIADWAEAVEAGVLALNYAESHGHSPYDGGLDREELFENALIDIRSAHAKLEEALDGSS